MSATLHGDMSYIQVPGDLTCGDCRFALKETAALKCRRYPPQVTILLIPVAGAVMRAGQQQVTPQGLSDYPSVAPGHPACGEWKIGRTQG